MTAAGPWPGGSEYDGCCGISKIRGNVAAVARYKCNSQKHFTLSTDDFLTCPQLLIGTAPVPISGGYKTGRDRTSKRVGLGGSDGSAFALAHRPALFCGCVTSATVASAQAVFSANDSQIRPRIGVRCELGSVLSSLPKGPLDTEQPFIRRRMISARPESLTVTPESAGLGEPPPST